MHRANESFDKAGRVDDREREKARRGASHGTCVVSLPQCTPPHLPVSVHVCVGVGTRDSEIHHIVKSRTTSRLIVDFARAEEEGKALISPRGQKG